MSDDGRLAAGLRIVEIGSSAAVAMAGMVAADAGAEVVMVESPGGSPLRSQAAFSMWGRGKQSLVADLHSEPDRARVLDLVREADVVLVGLKPASVERLGLGYPALSADNERLVYVALSGFGRGGPWQDVPAYDGSLTAKMGRMWEFGALHEGRRPAFTAAPVVAHGAAMLLLQGVFSALRERLHTGRGQCVETSLAQAAVIYDMVQWVPGALMQVRSGDTPFVAYSIARTKDGVWLQFAQNGPALFAALLDALGLEGLSDYATIMSRQSVEHLRECRAAIQARVAEHTWAEWQEIFEGQRNVSAEPFAPPGAALSHEQFLAMGDVVEVDDPSRGSTRQLGPLVDCPARPLRAHAPAPVAGSLAEGGFEGERVSLPNVGTASPGAGPLAGVTVVELGMWIALPFAGAQLAELGARVIKIEPLAGDPMRSVGPIALKMVQGKETLCLDLKAPEAQKIVHQLIAKADALIHSYRPGVPERLGIDFETLRAINPRLVHLYNGSYGSRGPKAYAAAFHVTGGAISGGAWAQAGEGTPPAADVEMSLDEVARASLRLETANEGNPDFNSAVSAAAAACMALYAAEAGGEGIELETRMMLSNAYMMSPWFVEGPGCEAPPLPDAELLGLSPLYRLYAASEGWVFLAAPGARDFERLCGVLGAPALDAFASADARAADPSGLAACLEACFARRSADDWERDLTSVGVSCLRADVGPFPRWGFDAQWPRETGLVCEVEASEVGAYTRYGHGVTTQSPAPLRGGFPPGQDTRSILAELGYDDSQIEDLLARGVAGATD